MSYDKKMSINEHIETADDLAIASHHLKKIFFRCQNYYPKNSDLMKQLSNILPSIQNSTFGKIKHLLDNEYHKTISESQLEELGHIYYNLDERYKDIFIINSKEKLT